MMANVEAETCSWYCRYCMYHFCQYSCVL